MCFNSTEVDLLGDEVDALTYLLKKVFGVLNHYSYVFEHYQVGICQTVDTGMYYIFLFFSVQCHSGKTMLYRWYQFGT
ncbi:hypothetical protein FCM35_KLT06546 [Carex littledalei]|uniref:Uncharacterized protein n=1 Tax=Carex littledalei TaxID=544730 RepID=A0A833QJS3_9POAL|nr:hypothetical protein FCM35_KLT06546 [Carex littledalei]